MFQINALATFVALFMPAFLPSCHVPHEVGSFFMDAPNIAQFMEVSPDGVIKCIKNCANCINRMQVPVGTMCVEFKCPYTPIHDKKLLPVQYSPPQYNCCQLLSQMNATNSDVLLFASCSPESMAISYVDNCDITWKSLWNLARECYADLTVTKPSVLHGQIPILKEDLKEYAKKKSTFVLEIPVLTGLDRQLEQRHSQDNLYKYVDDLSAESVHGESVNKEMFDLCQEAYKVIVKAHNLQRRKASEVLLFVCTDSDREFNKDKPTSIPIAYALKGRSIRIVTARKMLNVVRDRLKDNGTSVLCEAVDGQWSGIVFRDEQVKPLTLFELQRDSWVKFGYMSKEKLLQFIQDVSYVSTDDKEMCNQIDIDYFSVHRYGNIEVHIEPFRRPDDGKVVRQIFINSCCGDYNQGAALRFLRTPSKDDRPELWITPLGVTHNLLQVLGIDHTAVRQQNRHDSDIESDADEDDNFLNLRSDVVDESERTPDISTQDQDQQTVVLVSAKDIKSVLLGSHKHILEEILITLLCSERQHKWNSVTCLEFYDIALSSTHSIHESMTNHDLDIVINVLRKWECKEFPLGIKLNEQKLRKANQLGFILGHTDLIQPKKRTPKMKSLLDLSLDCAKTFVPTAVLRVALATFDFRIKLPLWMDRSPVPISYEIPIEPSSFDVFSYPEYNLKRQQIEPRIIYPSHVLTNLRVHATQKGILDCDPKAFLRVSETDNDVLSRGLLVQPIADQQSVPFARRIFSKNVEDIMQTNGDVKEANLVQYIRNWYDACNERRLSVTQRIRHLVDMHNYLMGFYDAEKFPMNTSYVCNVPSTTFQSIMQNISTRIHLYDLSKFHTYNHRSVSTLAVESLFSDLSTLAANTSGVPLAANIPKHIAKMTLLNAAKNNPVK